MSRIALLDATEATATAVSAALGADAIVACRRGNIPADARLVIAEVSSEGAFNLAALELPDNEVPLLVLVDRSMSFDACAPDNPKVAVLQKPFDLIDLRRIVRALLDEFSRPGPTTADSSTGPGPDRTPVSGNRRRVPASRRASVWFGTPRVAADVVPTLTAAARLDGAVWIVGEPGTGTDHVAAALAAAWDPDHEPVLWQESDSLASSVACLGDAASVLWVPDLDQRPLREQQAFERYLALEPSRHVVVTSADDPEAAVAAGTLLRSLQHALSRVSLRLAPLRERPDDVAALAISIGSAVAARAFEAERVALTDDARRTLESYPWPGNLTELDAVVTRTVIANGAPGARIVELGVEHLRFLPDHLATHDFVSAGSTALTHDENSTLLTTLRAAAAPPRRAVLVALGDMAAARAAKPSDSTSPNAAQAAESADVARQVAEQDSGVEAVLAAFAHDIRNPMSTIKTFAGLQAASAGADDFELARLAIEACERVDAHLEFLQRYAELTTATTDAVDIVETLGEAVDAAGDPSALTIVTRRALWVRTNVAVARFVADAIVAECRSRAAAAVQAASGSSAAGNPAEADIAAVPAALATAYTPALEIRIPVGSAAVDRLDKWVEGSSLPWRLALAREAARRGGGDLQVDVEDGQMRLHWRLPRVEEGKQHDDQTGSPDRRRRSRSS